MIKPTWESFLGPHAKDMYVSFVAEMNGFCVIELEGADAQEKGSKLITEIRRIINHEVTNLGELEEHINAAARETNVGVSYSLALGIIKHTVLYVVTRGHGQIYVQRQNKFAQLISGQKGASGYFHEDDLFIFTTNRFTEFVGGPEELHYVVSNKKLRDITAELSSNVTAEDNSGACVFVSFAPQGVPLRNDIVLGQKATAGTAKTQSANESSEEENEEDRGSRLGGLKNKFVAIWSKLTASGGDDHQSRASFIFKVVAVSLIFVILLWSVILRHSRQQAAETNKKIQTTRELVNQKLTQADDVAFLNLARAMTLISEAKTEVQKLRSEIGTEPNKELDALEKEISDKENHITKKEDKQYTEFFDLGIDQKDAQGVKLALDGATLSILDTQNSTVYLLDLDKKSLDKRTAGEVKSATQIGSFKDTYLAFVPNKGVFSLAGDKAKKVIEADADWGSISGMALYNGNIYLLDSGKSKIYKYSVIEGGYSPKSDYLKASTDNRLSGGTSLAIDSSVYVSLADSIIKYTAGAEDDFKTSFPDSQATITKIFTDKELDRAYAWDKSKGSLFVLAKNGSYERQVQSAVLSKGDDLVVYGKDAYVLMKNKIYKIATE